MGGGRESFNNAGDGGGGGGGGGEGTDWPSLI